MSREEFEQMLRDGVSRITRIPKVSDTVIYTAGNDWTVDRDKFYENVTHAAIILDVPDKSGLDVPVALHIFPAMYRNKNGAWDREMREPKLPHPMVPFSETPKPGHWSWPPRG